MQKIVFLILCISIANLGNTQVQGPPRQIPNGSFYGKIVEAKSQKPIEFASIQILQSRMDSASKKMTDVVIAGMITKANGEFRLENIPAVGKLKLSVTIVGFANYQQDISFDLKPGNGNQSNPMAALDKDLGNIKIEFAEKVLENVTVTSSKPGLQLGIDRKVFNVDKNLVSAGGTAVDIMRNVPSLNVDLDGNVTMRNNTPQIFVDGRPSTMSLDQIPADAIESVELITNPSAKFDASGGTAGILNVVLKKNKRVGYSGSMRTSIDSRARVGLGGDINIRQDKINFFAGANLNQRKSISDGTTDRTTFLSTPNTFLKQEDYSVFKGYFSFFRGGVDYFIDNRNTLSLSGNYAAGGFSPVSESDLYIDSLYPVVKSSFSERLSYSDRDFKNAGASLSFKHNFPRQGEELTADMNYNSSKNNSSNEISNNYFSVPGNSLIGTAKQLQEGKGGFENMVFQADYSRPLNEKSKFETGIRAQIRNVDNRNDFYFYSPSGQPVYNADLSVYYTSRDHVYAAYATYSNKIKDFGYQAGLRLESSDYEGKFLTKTNLSILNFLSAFFLVFS